VGRGHAKFVDLLKGEVQHGPLQTGQDRKRGSKGNYLPDAGCHETLSHQHIHVSPVEGPPPQISPNFLVDSPRYSARSRITS
jgi:hypothetical protein